MVAISLFVLLVLCNSLIPYYEAKFVGSIEDLDFTYAFPYEPENVTWAITEKPKNATTTVSNTTPQPDYSNLYQAIPLLSNQAITFIKMLNEFNDKNYRSLVRLLSQISSSLSNPSDFENALQIWVRIAEGSEQLTESFLQRMSALVEPNRPVEHATVLLSNLKTYMESYISDVLKRQDAALQTAFDMLDRDTLTKEELTLLDTLFGFQQRIQAHSFKTLNEYVGLVDGLAAVTKDSR
ncbi:unnamed protein product [Dicrocoelium dendriticum]|nr:unnamed protein product [Dicrocoelium dendriticum]